MNRGLIAAVLAALALALPSQGPRAAEPVPVQAGAPGPLWWRIDNGGESVLWVLGVPDGMIESLRWNDASLRTRLASARLLLSPLLGKSLHEPPPPCLACHWDYAISTTPGGATSQAAPIRLIWPRTIGGSDFAGSPSPFTSKDSLSETLPPELFSRLNAVLPAGDARGAILNSSPANAALWLDLWNWPRGEQLGNPVTDRAINLAQNQRLAVKEVYVPALWKPILVDDHLAPPDNTANPDFDWLWNIRPNVRIVPPQGVQINCLAQVVSQAETGQMPALRQAAMAAWARGDLDNALKRSNDVQYCLMGDLPSTSAKDFIQAKAQTYISSLDHAFDQPGQTVAIVEFDPLLLGAGGILDHYRRLGFGIATSDGMGD